MKDFFEALEQSIDGYVDQGGAIEWSPQNVLSASSGQSHPQTRESCDILALSENVCGKRASSRTASTKSNLNFAQNRTPIKIGRCGIEASSPPLGGSNPPPRSSLATKEPNGTFGKGHGGPPQDSVSFGSPG